MQQVFKIGSKIEITRIDKRTWEERPTQYISKIADIKDSMIYIFTPIKESVYVTFFIDEVLRIYRSTRDGVWVFEAEVVDRLKEPDYMIVVKPLSEIKKIQRRMFYRLPISLDIKIKHLEDEQKESSDGQYVNGKLIKAITKDLSGGGVCFLTDGEFEKGTKVVIKINIDNEELTLKGVILRKERLESKAYKYEYACKFFDAQDTAIDKIVKFIFKEQQKMRQKGIF